MSWWRRALCAMGIHSWWTVLSFEPAEPGQEVLVAINTCERCGATDKFVVAQVAHVGGQRRVV